MSETRVFVVGNAGFIGRALVDYLQSKEHYRVAGLDVRNAPGNANFVAGDCNVAAEIMQRFQPDVIVNASGAANVQASFSNPEHDRMLNLTNVEVLLDATRQYAPDARLINLSSAAVYGVPVSLPIREADAHGAEPISPYGRHKQGAEQALLRAAEIDGLHTLSARIFSCFGEGQKKLLMWDLFQKIRVNPDRLELFGDGEESRDFLHVDDVCRALETMMHSATFDGGAINVASGRETTIRSVAETAIALLGASCSLHFNGQRRPGDPHNWRADTSILERLGFHPSIDLEMGMQRYFRWLKSSETHRVQPKP